MAKTQGRIFVCKESFLWGDEFFEQGVTRVREGHPILDGKEHLFEELEVHYEVERATANPGEKRGETR